MSGYLQLWFVALLIGMASPAHAIRYELVDGGGGDQRGHTLSGFIEFDIPCDMNCTRANITNFAFSVSGPSNYSYAYKSPPDVYFHQVPGIQRFIIAGIDTLRIDYLRAGTLSLGDGAAGYPYIYWLGSLTDSYGSGGPSDVGGGGKTDS